MRSDAQLVDEVLAGRREAFAELVLRHERSVLAVAGSLVRHTHDAQDIAQETFLLALEKLAFLRQRQSFGAWVLQIARRKAYVLRRQKRLRPLSDDPLAAAPSNGRLDEETAEVIAAVLALPAPQRTVVFLRFFGHHDTRAVAAITGRPLGTVRSQLSRAMAVLRDRLEDAS